jgi:transposase-like protein
MGLSDEERLRTLAALEASGGNISAAARDLGLPRKTVANRVRSAQASGLIAKRDNALVVTGRSTLRDLRTGEDMLQWERETVDRDRLTDLIHETIAALACGIEPAQKTPARKGTNSDTLVAYQVGDAHLGSYSWGPECSGGSFDINIAEQDLMTAVDRLIASTPDADEAIIVNVGDWFHTDSSKPFTPASGNLLDVGDTRWPKVVNSGVRILREICRRALLKHKRVRLRNAKGNHDPHSGIILDVAMKAYFENEPRLIVEDSPRDLWFFRFGNNLIGITHGHNVKLDNLPGLLAVDAREDWGQCEFRYIWAGHWHAKKVLDIMETRVTVWPTLAANDKWHTEKGYRSKKEMCALVLHKDFGVMEEHTAGLRLVRHG